MVAYRVGINCFTSRSIACACICEELSGRGAKAPLVASGLSAGGSDTCCLAVVLDVHPAERLSRSQAASSVPCSVKREHPLLPPVAGPEGQSSPSDRKGNKPESKGQNQGPLLSKPLGRDQASGASVTTFSKEPGKTPLWGQLEGSNMGNT